MRELTVRRTSFVCGASGGENSSEQAPSKNAAGNFWNQTFEAQKI
jgi:hypothetical protein